MIYIETKLPGAYVIKIKSLNDDRGMFGRSFCRREFSERGLNPDVAQCSISFNLKSGTLRGMHYQKEPHAEDKVVRCTRGSLYDVIIDLRANSPTFKQWVALELTEENRLMLYVPKGFAHGFKTLTDNTEVFYQMSEFYHPESACGVRWNDPAIGIHWPDKDRMIISDRDNSWPDY
jgi:dTDP-4-dehydrorhamnose 3,5-epimerase